MRPVVAEAPADGGLLDDLALIRSQAIDNDHLMNMADGPTPPPIDGARRPRCQGLAAAETSVKHSTPTCCLREPLVAAQSAGRPRRLDDIGTEFYALQRPDQRWGRSNWYTLGDALTLGVDD